MVDNPPDPAAVRRLSRPFSGEDIPWAARIRVLGIWLGLMVFLTFVLVVRLPLSGQVALGVGDVASRDIVAPRQITFPSEIETAQRRELAANGVLEVYDPPQARIGRQRLTVASQIIEYLNTVRADSFAEPADKIRSIQAIGDLDLPDAVLERIVTLPNPSWERVAAEILVVLDRAMREEIRENNLADERRKVPARVRLDMADEDALIVSEVVQELLVPNSFFNAERTDQRRLEAREAVEPVTETLERNEVILRAGDIVTNLDIEALEALGLQQRTWSWEDFRSAVGFVFLLGLVFLYYLWRVEPRIWLEQGQVLLLALVVAGFVLAAKIVIPARTVAPYIFPYAGLTMSLAVILNPRLAVVITALVTLIIGYLTNGSLELMTYAFAGSLVGMLKVRRGERLSSFAWGMIYIALFNLLAVAAFWLGGSRWDWRGLLELSGAAVASALLAITVTTVGLYLLGALFGTTTSLQLLEISRPTHPLLRQLLLKAPGTYHHALIVSNMSERAAEAIGADALLTRVGGYYHDVGKTLRPYFFVENRSEGVDPHGRLDPFTSAQIIISHVKDGIELARKYRLPQRIIDFIPEHKGTLPVSYFYHQAVQQAGSEDKVDASQFQYPGPKPQSRETALTMLADGAEATVRARRPASIEELDQIVGESIQSRVLSGQLDECPLTLADLDSIRRAFVDVLRGLHHPRISYPGAPAVAAPQENVGPALQAGQAGANGHVTQDEEEPDDAVSDPTNGSQSAF